MSNEWEFYQIPATGVTSTTLGIPVQTRDLNMRMSNFGALVVGKRLTNDYTRVNTMAFIDKGILEGAAQFGLHDLIRKEAEMIENPLVWGSTVKYTWNDEMFKMGMDTDIGKTLRAGGTKLGSYKVAFPKFDVMDTNLISSGMVAKKNWPTEGWRSFGGKYDFLPYSGGGFTH